MNFARRFYQHLAAFKKNIFLVITFHILTAIFTVISIPMIIPFFQILFDEGAAVSKSNAEIGLVDNIEIYISQLVTTHGKQETLLYVCISIVLIFFMKNVFRYLAMYFITPVRNGIIQKIRSQLYGKFQSLPLSFLKDSQKGNLLSIMSSDVQEVEWSIVNTLEAFFKSPLIIIGSIIFMVTISPTLSLFVLLLLVVTVFLIGGISRTLKKKSGLAQSTLGELLSTVDETIYGFKAIKLYNADEYFHSKFEQRNKRYKDILNRVLWRRDLSSPLSEFLGILVVTVLLWVGSNQVFESEITAGVFFAFIFAFYQVIEPAKSFATAYYNVQKGLGALDRIDSLLAEESINTPIEKSMAVREFSDKIEFKNISFKYENAWVLETINLKLCKGERIAIVGPSGSGKTSLTDLLLGFYKQDRGEILIDNVNIQSISKYELRSLFSVVNQHPILFHDTVATNIAMSDTYDINKVKHAAILARADKFIDKLALSYESVVGSEGMKLSGGERQRICLARAIYRNAPIVILDEATSSIDAASESEIQEAMNQFLKEKTSIVIAHKLHTIQNADKIIVLEKGKIIQKGTHEQLLQGNSGKHYQKIVELQTV